MFIGSISGCSHDNGKLRTCDNMTTGKEYQDVLNSVSNLYPDRFKAVQRVILTFAGRDYVLTGYLLIDRPKREIKLILQNDLGGIVFDMHYIENQLKHIQSNLKTVNGKWLEKTLLRDLKTIYLFKPLPKDLLLLEQPDTYIWERQNNKNKNKLLLKPSRGSTLYRLQEIKHFKGDSQIYSVVFRYESENQIHYPEHIFITDAKMNYTVKINVRYFLQ